MTTGDEGAPKAGDFLWRDVAQHQVRALKRLDADADRVTLATPTGSPSPQPHGALRVDVIAAGFDIQARPTRDHWCSAAAPQAPPQPLPSGSPAVT